MKSRIWIRPLGSAQGSLRSPRCEVELVNLLEDRGGPPPFG